MQPTMMTITRSCCKRWPTAALQEAFAEVLHKRTRTEFWGYAKDEQIALTDLVNEEYQGIRPAPGYPACPDHTEKYKLFDLLNATEHAGITLTESLAMYPGAAVCGWYFSHPESSLYFWHRQNIRRPAARTIQNAKE